MMFRLYVFLLCVLMAVPSHALEIKSQDVSFYANKTDGSITFYNDRKVPVNVYLSLENFVMNSQARVQKVKDFSYSLKSFLYLGDSQITLKPEEQKTVYLSIKNINKMDGGDYHSHLTYREELKRKDNTLELDVSIPVVFKGATDDDKIIMNDIKIQDKKIWLNFTKEGRKNNKKNWIEISRERNGLVEELSTPFYNKIYREAGGITRKVPYKLALEKGDKVIVSMWNSPKKNKLQGQTTLVMP